MENQAKEMAYNSAAKNITAAINDISTVIMESTNPDCVNFVEKQQNSLYNVLQDISRNKQNVFNNSDKFEHISAVVTAADAVNSDDTSMFVEDSDGQVSMAFDTVDTVDESNMGGSDDSDKVEFYGYSQTYQNHFEFEAHGCMAKLLRGSELPIALLDSDTVHVDETTRKALGDLLKVCEVVKKDRSTSSKGNDSVLVLTEDSQMMHIRMVVQLITNRCTYALNARARANKDILNMFLRDYLAKVDNLCVEYHKYQNEQESIVKNIHDALEDILTD